MKHRLNLNLIQNLIQNPNFQIEKRIVIYFSGWISSSSSSFYPNLEIYCSSFENRICLDFSTHLSCVEIENRTFRVENRTFLDSDCRDADPHCRDRPQSGSWSRDLEEKNNLYNNVIIMHLYMAYLF